VPYQAPTNLVATIFPQPTYNTSVTVTTPTVAAPQAVQFQVTQPGTAPVFGVPYGQAPHAPSAVPLSTEARLDRLEVALGQLCETLKVTNTVKAPEPVRTPGLPRVLGSKCAICHTPAKAKGEFVLFDKGQLAALTAKDFARMHRYVAANKCPPANNPENVVPLDDAEKSELLDWISKQPK
jgi:hypothetical protein